MTAPGFFGGSGTGGAIDDEEGFSGQGTLTIKGTTFTRNLAQGGSGGSAYGGALNASGSGLTLFLTSCTLIDNTAAGGAGNTARPFGGYGNGGALNVFQATVTATDSSFIGNRALGGSATGAGGSPAGACIAPCKTGIVVEARRM